MTTTKRKRKRKKTKKSTGAEEGATGVTTTTAAAAGAVTNGWNGRSTLILVYPHPSGVSHFWNLRTNRVEATTILRSLMIETGIVSKQTSTFFSSEKNVALQNKSKYFVIEGEGGGGGGGGGGEGEEFNGEQDQDVLESTLKVALL